MGDQRISKLAKLLVHYSLELKKGDYMLLEAYDLAAPLVREVFREAIKAGAYVDTNIFLPGLTSIFYREASEEQLKFISPYMKFKSENYNAFLMIHGQYNFKELTNVPSERIQTLAQATREINVKLMQRMSDRNDLRWCITLFPGPGSAQEAEMGTEEYEDFVYEAGNLNMEDPISAWRELSAHQQKLCDFLLHKKSIHIISEDTDLKLDVSGRKWINCDGKENFPDGEIFTSPHVKNVEGKIKFSYPVIMLGKEVDGIYLEFKEGKVITARSEKGEDFLHSLLDIDENARYVGELGIGTNYNIKKFTKNLLFDEKIGGTIHIATGSAFPEAGGDNVSGVHVDMVCDMKKSGEIYADGELIYKQGKFINQP
jgi:aminopeptidase